MRSVLRIGGALAALTIAACGASEADKVKRSLTGIDKSAESLEGRFKKLGAAAAAAVSVGAIAAFARSIATAADQLADLGSKLNANTGTAGRIFNDPAFYDNMTGLAGDMRLLIGDFRKDPKKFLRVKFSIF